jgi:uncharacterized protein YbjQ (UPF0145 family)
MRLRVVRYMREELLLIKIGVYNRPLFFYKVPAMLMTNIETIPGKTITACHGVVSGSSVRSKHVGRDIMAGLKNMVGGELKGYTELLEESRAQATERMQAQATQMGANAVVNVRFSTSSVAAGAAEIYVYGTAVTVG